MLGPGYILSAVRCGSVFLVAIEEVLASARQLSELVLVLHERAKEVKHQKFQFLVPRWLMAAKPPTCLGLVRGEDAEEFS